MCTHKFPCLGGAVVGQGRAPGQGGPFHGDVLCTINIPLRVGLLNGAHSSGRLVVCRLSVCPNGCSSSPSQGQTEVCVFCCFRPCRVRSLPTIACLLEGLGHVSCLQHSTPSFPVWPPPVPFAEEEMSGKLLKSCSRMKNSFPLEPPESRHFSALRPRPLCLLVFGSVDPECSGE